MFRRLLQSRKHHGGKSLLGPFPPKAYAETKTSQAKPEKSLARRVIVWILFRAFLPLMDTFQRASPTGKHKFMFSQNFSYP
jgi:hypothetical protein